MCREDIDSIPKKSETSRALRKYAVFSNKPTRRTCPEQGLLGGNPDECGCLLRFRTELKNRFDSILS